MGRHDDKEDSFDKSGPTHLTQTEIDWDNNDHRRCITASLVKGTYVLESDRTKEREKTSKALAPAWWETFHFRKLPEYKLERQCNCVICEMFRHKFGSRSGNGFIYGAVFEYTPPDGVPRHPSAPSHVVAFRGTMTRDPIVLNDMLQNFRILINKQHICRRFVDARENVHRLLSEKIDDNGSGSSSSSSSRGEIWLAGHSLGASIALDVGRDMVTRGRRGCCNPPTFLFNPPNVSAAPLIGVLSEQAKRHLYISSYAVKSALGKTILRSHREHMEELFKQLSPWVPNLYVHRRDIICKGFIDYFEKREQVKEWSARVVNSATTLSYRDMVFHRHSERQQLLPCAVLWIAHGDDPHGLRQWWRRTGPADLDLTRNEYSWSSM